MDISQVFYNFIIIFIFEFKKIGFGFLVAILGEFVLSPGTAMMVVWVVLIIAVLFGALLGYVAMRLPRAGFFALGFWLGIILAFMLNNAALS